MPSLQRLLALSLLAGALGACASLKAPAVRVASLHLDGVSVTGARLDVAVDVRNVNPQDLRIERFEYELKLNGQTLGRGYQADPLMLGGFKEDKVVSRLDINLLKIPGAVQRVLDRDRVDAEIKGAFYVQDGASLRKLKFGTRGNVDLRRDGGRGRRD